MGSRRLRSTEIREKKHQESERGDFRQMQLWNVEAAK